jgi:hypothetical protein
MRPGLKRREATIAADMAGLGGAANAADMEGLEVVANAVVVAVSVGDAAAGVEEEAVSTAEAAAEAAAAEAETDNIWSDVLESRWFAGLGVVRFTYYIVCESHKRRGMAGRIGSPEEWNRSAVGMRIERDRTLVSLILPIAYKPLPKSATTCAGT